MPTFALISRKKCFQLVLDLQKQGWGGRGSEAADWEGDLLEMAAWGTSDNVWNLVL